MKRMLLLSTGKFLDEFIRFFRQLDDSSHACERVSRNGLSDNRAVSHTLRLCRGESTKELADVFLNRVSSADREDKKEPEGADDVKLIASRQMRIVSIDKHGNATYG